MTGEPSPSEDHGPTPGGHAGCQSADAPERAFPGALLLARLTELPFMIALRHGLLTTMPLVLVGAFAHFINALLTYPAIATLLVPYDEIARTVCASVVSGTFGLVALGVVLGFAFSIGQLSEHSDGRAPVAPCAVALVALSSFVLIVAPETLDDWRAAMSSSQGLPAALTVTIASSYIFLFLARRPLFRLSTRGFAGDPMVGEVLSILPAAAVTILLLAGLRELQILTGSPGLMPLLSSFVAAPFAGAEVSAAFAAAVTFVGQVFWFVGAHGASMLGAVQDNMLTATSQANFDAVAAGLEPTEIVTRQFFTVYTRIGGSGATICLVIALLIGDREPATRRLAILSLLPALINVNEPLIFGLPLILNPVYAIPFLLTPVVQALIGYSATAAGIVPAIGYPVPWTLPPLVSGWVGTGSVMGSLVQLLAIAIGIGIYLPFVHVAARLRVSANRLAMRKLVAASEVAEAGLPSPRLVELPGHAGRLAKTLAQDLAYVLERGERLYLEYQPQVFIKEKRVFGVEALLRWDHGVYGAIPPPVIVALAEDTRRIGQLGAHVLRLACRQRVAWARHVPADLILSVNVSPHQLADPGFDVKVLDILAEEGLAPHLLELEITESTALLPAVHSIDALHRLRLAGVRIALDDFGMGHTSLHYLRELPLNTLKIDRSLTFTSQGNLNEHVIRSIMTLSQTLGLFAVVEGIEQPEQLPRFIDLGCDRFQGYLFSRPLKSGPCLDYILSNAGL